MFGNSELAWSWANIDFPLGFIGHFVYDFQSFDYLNSF